MMLQNFGFVLALAVLLPCLIEGRSEQNYLNGILFEAPADVPKSDSVRKFSFEEFHNELVPIFEILPAHLPLSKLKNQNEFKKFLETELLYDAPEDVLYDTRDIVSIIYDLADAGISSTGFIGSIFTGLCNAFGAKEYIVGKIGAEEAAKAEREMQRALLIEAVSLVLNSMNDVLNEAFDAAVETRTVTKVNEAVKNVEKLWRPRLRQLRKKLGLPTIDDRRPKHGAINTKNNRKSQ